VMLRKGDTVVAALDPHDIAEHVTAQSSEAAIIRLLKADARLTTNNLKKVAEALEMLFRPMSKPKPRSSYTSPRRSLAIRACRLSTLSSSLSASAGGTQRSALTTVHCGAWSHMVLDETAPADVWHDHNELTAQPTAAGGCARRHVPSSCRCAVAALRTDGMSGSFL
jgi:hypothetical protein